FKSKNKDWICRIETCKESNFGQRDQCRKCQTHKKLIPRLCCHVSQINTVITITGCTDYKDYKYHLSHLKYCMNDIISYALPPSDISKIIMKGFLVDSDEKEYGSCLWIAHRLYDELGDKIN